MKKLGDLYTFAQQQDISVFCYSLPRCGGSLSCVLPGGACAIGIDPMMLRGEWEERERLAHELGHCVLGAFYNSYSDFDSVSRHEARAVRWATDQLIPPEELTEALRRGLSPHELAEHFGVGEQTVHSALFLLRSRLEAAREIPLQEGETV